MLSYHSLEDRLVKHAFQRLAREGSFQRAHQKSHSARRRGNRKQSARAQREDARCGKELTGANDENARPESLLMTEYHTVKQIDNSRLFAPAAAGAAARFLAAPGSGRRDGRAACCSTPGSISNASRLRYQVEQLESQRTQAAELNQQLHLEVATLRSPVRVDAIARNQLGLDGSGARASGCRRRAERCGVGSGAHCGPATAGPESISDRRR